MFAFILFALIRQHQYTKDRTLINFPPRMKCVYSRYTHRADVTGVLYGSDIVAFRPRKNVAKEYKQSFFHY